MTTNEVRPYTDEDVARIRARREDDARNGVELSGDIVARWLATLDERDRQLAEAMPPRALREWREALGEYAPENTGGWSPLVGATWAVVRDLAERTRERDEARDSERKAWESCRETCVNLAAAERRAEEAERRLYDAEAWVRTLDDVESVAVRALEHYATRAYESATDSDGQVQLVAEEALAAMRAIRAAHGRPQQHEADDDDVDPAKWQPGDVVVRPGLMDGEEYQLNTRSLSPPHWGFFRRPWRFDPIRGPVLMLLDTEARSKGWRRIRRASTEERRG